MAPLFLPPPSRGANTAQALIPLFGVLGRLNGGAAAASKFNELWPVTRAQPHVSRTQNLASAVVQISLQHIMGIFV